MLAVTDPVASGIVKSIARPEGNVTGISHMSPYGTNAKSSNVRETAAFGDKSGRDMLSMSSSHYDPEQS